ncbi:MAG: TerB family tellurite resistance protein [Porticoccaceae bacterium]
MESLGIGGIGEVKIVETFAIRTCYGCGKKKPANELHKKRVPRSGTYNSRKSVTPLTFLGFFLGSKKAKGALESWMFNTSNRKGKLSGTKEVNLCDDCVSSGGSLIGYAFQLIGYPFKFLYFVVKWLYVKPFIFLSKNIIALLKWIMTKVTQFGIILLPIVLKILQKVGLASIVGIKTGAVTLVSKHNEIRSKRNIAEYSDAEIIKIAFESREFLSIAEFLFLTDVAMSDGEKSKNERVYLNEKIEISDEAKFIGKQIHKNDEVYRVFKELIRGHIQNNELLVRNLIGNLFYIAEADGTVSFDEIEMISRISNDLGISKKLFEEIKKGQHERVIGNNNRFVAEDIEQKIIDLMNKNDLSKK